MRITKRERFTTRWPKNVLLFAALASILLHGGAAAQGLTGALIGTVKDVVAERFSWADKSGDTAASRNAHMR